MWTKSKDYNVKILPEINVPPVLVSPEFRRQSELHTISDFNEKEFNIIVSFSYAIVPSVNSVADKVNVLRWVLSRWTESLSFDELKEIPLHQVEYFFTGSENGQLFVFPLIPFFTLKSVIELFPQKDWCKTLRKEMESTQNSNCGSRLLLHRHAREEPVSGLHVLGTLVVSSSADGSVALSSFHPVCRAVTLIPHPHPVRTVKLWEGKPFSSGLSSEEFRRREETAAVYIFSGDTRGTVRLWRVNVLTRTYVLQHVFLMSPSCLGMRSPLDVSLREDKERSPIERETTNTVHCMTIDGDERILVGAEGSVYCWAIDELPWKDKFDVGYHPLQWSHEFRDALQKMAPSSVSQVKIRAERLVNHHVWVRDHAFVSLSIEKWTGRSISSPKKARPQVSRWKAKHGRNIAGGISVGIVSNEVQFAAPESVTNEDVSTSSILSNSLVTVSFEEGELLNDVVLPLSCVEPVVYPLFRLALPVGACFAMEMLERGRRLVTCTSNNCTTVWNWDSERTTFVPLVVAGDESAPRGLGKNICVFRSPDIFLTSGYDDGLVKEWHLHENPHTLLRCERRLMVLKADQLIKSSDGEVTPVKGEQGECADGISSMLLLPSFGALFVVGVLEHTIQTFRFGQAHGCEPPPSFLYNGFRTIQLTENLRLEEYLGESHS